MNVTQKNQVGFRQSTECCRLGRVDIDYFAARFNDQSRVIDRRDLNGSGGSVERLNGAPGLAIAMAANTAVSKAVLIGPILARLERRLGKLEREPRG